MELNNTLRSLADLVLAVERHEVLAELDEDEQIRQIEATRADVAKGDRIAEAGDRFFEESVAKWERRQKRPEEKRDQNSEQTPADVDGVAYPEADQPTRRQLVRGHIAKKSNRYYVVIYEGPDPSSGKAHHRWHVAGGTRKDAERLLADLVKKSHDGDYRSSEPPSPSVSTSKTSGFRPRRPS